MIEAFVVHGEKSTLLLTASPVPPGFDERRTFDFDNPPEGCVVVPFGPFHPTLDEPAHFRLFVDGEIVRGCEYRGFMVHRAIEKLGDSVLTYNEIPMAAERICGICGCVHATSYVQAVEEAAAEPPPRRGMRPGASPSSASDRGAPSAATSRPPRTGSV